VIETIGEGTDIARIAVEGLIPTMEIQPAWFSHSTPNKTFSHSSQLILSERTEG